MKTRAFAIIHENQKFLLIREGNLKFKNQWYFPGGTLEENENISSGLMREVKEEAGYTIGINGISFLKYVDRPVSRKGLYIYCSCRTIAGAVKMISDEHSLEACWFDLNEIAYLNKRGDLAERLQMYGDELPLLPTEYLQLNGTG